MTNLETGLKGSLLICFNKQIEQKGPVKRNLKLSNFVLFLAKHQKTSEFAHFQFFLHSVALAINHHAHAFLYIKKSQPFTVFLLNLENKSSYFSRI